MLVIDTQGSTLAGAIDGVNCDYTTSLDYAADSVQVFINGRLKVLDPSYVDGADVLGNRKIRLREPLQIGDTLAVSYQLASEGSYGGAADVGQPSLSVRACDAAIAPARVHVHAASCGAA